MRPSGTERLEAWIEGLPEWLRPPFYGALFLLLMLKLKGAAILLPLGVLGILFTSKTPGPDLVRLANFFLIAILGGFAAGVGYTLVGRWIRRIPLIGPYLAGIATIVPYTFALALIIRIDEARPLLGALTRTELIVMGVISVLFGPPLGYIFFRDDDGESVKLNGAAG